MYFNLFIKRSVFILLNVISFSLLAQEQLKPLNGNINLPIIPNNTLLSKKTTSVTPIDLPFFDDFSYADKTPYPSTNNWLDSNAYINTGFAIAPITLGVATFDGLNKKGYPYSINVPVSYSGVADTLTSRPINLKATTTHTYVAADSIFLSFYYQAEGKGDSPEPNDSLSVDFWKPNQNKWKKVWGVKGYNPSATDTTFYRVRIAITDTSYLDSLFKFRFRNTATLSGSLDHWHVDYVQIKQNYLYADTVLDDIAFVYKPSSFLKNYSVMPYRQYNRTLEMAPGFRNFMRNNFNVAKFSVYNYTIKDEFGVTVPSDVYGTFNNPGFLPFLNNGYYTGIAATPVFTLQPFPVTFSDSTFFTIQHVISSSGDTKNVNDTLTHVQKFGTYYAYDDGTAEQAYYLNTYGAKTAMRFTLNVFDTLKSVRIYFDPITDGTAIQASSFRLMVWAAGSNGPGNIILKDSLVYPTYVSGSYNLMPTYNLTSCLPLGVGTYYIGLQQTTNKALNIGFDRNTNHKDALYYDIGNGWVQSAIPGSLMINPVMGCTYPEPVGINETQKADLIKIFPNPAQDKITISYPGNQLENLTIEILSALGQVVYSSSIVSNEQIDISNIANGLYFIHLKGNNLNLPSGQAGVSPKKLIISR